jgi:uncharacterized repeat protein (TIGR04076 family)
MLIKITVVKKTLNSDLAEEYLVNKAGTCEAFSEGQQFFVDGNFRKPEGFCDWAWTDIHKTVTALYTGGNFSTGMFEGWMKNPNSMIACCTDGIRPVIFKVERV